MDVFSTMNKDLTQCETFLTRNTLWGVYPQYIKVREFSIQYMLYNSTYYASVSTKRNYVNYMRNLMNRQEIFMFHNLSNLK